MDIPPIQYAKTSDGVNIASQVFGQGPPVLVTPALLINHLRLMWERPGDRTFFERLAERTTVIRYDPRGMGMSPRDCVDFSPEAAILDIDAVVDRVGIERFAIYGIYWSADSPFAYAARRPVRVTRLALWCPRANQQRLLDVSPGFSPGSHFNPRWQQDARVLMDVNWELYANVRARLVQGWDSPEATASAAIYVAIHTPESFRAAEESILAAETSLIRCEVRVPTLVLYRVQNAAMAAKAQAVGAEIPDSRLLGIPGGNYLLGSTIVAAAVDDFVNQPAEEGEGPAVPTPDVSSFRAILFTDIEAHTAMMQRLGDTKGHDVLRDHERISREALRAHGGTEIKTIGDSFMASFPSAQKAVECAIALQRAFASVECGGERLRIRVGINAGEPIAEEDDLFGSTVILASRTKAKAAGGEILVTDVVRQLVSGKGFLFADRGDMEMKGFEEPARLFEVRWE
jgi:class 3 adenylate cyclase/pimeloyl-ACP methyl ester carboxylesterase